MSAGHIRKRGDSWQAIAYLGIVNGKKKYKSRTAKTKKEARRLLTELQHQINNNTFADPGKVTLGEYLKKYVEEFLTDAAPKTIESYTAAIKNHIEPAIGHIKLANLKPYDLQNYYNRLAKENTLSNNTIRWQHGIIHAALKRAFKLELISRNVADGAEPPKRENVQYGLVGKECLFSILEMSKQKKPEFVLPIILAYSLGMRRGEVLGLMWKDIDIAKGTLRVQRQLQRVGKNLFFREPKTDSSTRTVNLSASLVAMLKKHSAAQAQRKLLSEGRYNDNDLVCCTSLGEPLSPELLTISFKRYAMYAGVDDISFHDLRHTYATEMLDQKVNPKAVSEWLGHSDIKVTLGIYSHTSEESRGEITGIIEEKIKRAGLTLE